MYALKRYFKKFSLGLISILILTGCPYQDFIDIAHADNWRQAIGPWKWIFPRDHGSHPEFRTEWWYFTGNLKDSSNNRFGYQLTFFRQGVFLKPKEPSSPWSIRDIYLAHFALTDVFSEQFQYAEHVSRQGPGLAGASQNGMDVWLLNWRAKMEGNRVKIAARHQGMELSLDLLPRKPIVFHGESGFSQKGPKQGQASYYYSFTNMATEGRIKTPKSELVIPVKGTSWFDHEFGSNQLAPDQVGWDWFSLHLSDGQELMVYFLRRKDGMTEPSSSGTLVKRSGNSIHLKRSDIHVEVLDTWKSLKSNGIYPSRWRMKVPSAGIGLELRSLVPSQELITEGSTGVIYWEGAVAGKGVSAGKSITCEGYVELTGYVGSLGGIF